MHFILYCLDKTDAAQVRLDNRSAHLEYAKTWGEAVSLAGPLLADPLPNDKGERMIGSMIGSMIVLNVESRAEVDRFIAGDPYGLAGLFQSVTVHGYKLAISHL